MNNKHKKILYEIFKNPVSKKVKYKDIESLLKHLGCEIVEGDGSKVRFRYNKHRYAFHKPHPQPDVKTYVILDLREFLKQIGGYDEI